MRQRSQETNWKWEVTLILSIFPFYFCFLFFKKNLALFNHYQSCKRRMAQLCEISLVPLFLILKLINLRYHPECCQWEFSYLLSPGYGNIAATLFSICHREACVCVFIGFLLLWVKSRNIIKLLDDGTIVAFTLFSLSTSLKMKRSVVWQ